MVATCTDFHWTFESPDLQIYLTGRADLHLWSFAVAQ